MWSGRGITLTWHRQSKQRRCGVGVHVDTSSLECSEIVVTAGNEPMHSANDLNVDRRLCPLYASLNHNNTLRMGNCLSTIVVPPLCQGAWNKHNRNSALISEAAYTRALQAHFYRRGHGVRALLAPCVTRPYWGLPRNHSVARFYATLSNPPLRASW